MKQFIILIISIFSFAIGYSQDYCIELSNDKFGDYSCVIVFGDTYDCDFTRYSLRADEIRWETKSSNGLYTGLYLWDDSRAVTWYSSVADPSAKSDSVFNMLQKIETWRARCRQ